MEVEEDDEWSQQDELIQNEDENSIAGEDALVRSTGAETKTGGRETERQSMCVRE